MADTPSDIQIAQQSRPRPVIDIAAELGLGGTPVRRTETPYSFAADAGIVGGPARFRIVVNDVYPAAGAALSWRPRETS